MWLRQPKRLAPGTDPRYELLNPDHQYFAPRGADHQVNSTDPSEFNGADLALSARFEHRTPEAFLFVQTANWDQPRPRHRFGAMSASVYRGKCRRETRAVIQLRSLVRSALAAEVRSSNLVHHRRAVRGASPSRSAHETHPGIIPVPAIPAGKRDTERSLTPAHRAPVRGPLPWRSAACGRRRPMELIDHELST